MSGPATSPASGTRDAVRHALQAAAAPLNVAQVRKALALLAVLRDILSDARAGDLDRDGEAVHPDSVEAWFRERCPRELKDLAEELFGSPAADPLAEVRQDLIEWLDDRKLAPLEDAAKGIERPLAQVEECVVASPSHFGRLPGPPVVVYLHVPDSIAGEA